MTLEKRVIVCDYNKCNRCGICETECAMAMEESLDSSLSRIQVAITESIHHMAIACQLCDDPPCVKSCPRGALLQSESGSILVNEDKCTGCMWCINACDFGAIMPNPTKKIAFCDVSCIKTSGEEPPCVKACPYEALTFSTMDELSSKQRKDVINKLFSPRLMVS